MGEQVFQTKFAKIGVGKILIEFNYIYHIHKTLYIIKMIVLLGYAYKF